METHMLFFSNGALVDPHVLGRQLTHCARAAVPDEVQEEDVLQQCCACLDPSSHLHGGPSRLQLSMAVTTETFDKPRLAQEVMRLVDGPLESQRLLWRRQQQIVFHLLAASRHCESRHSCVSSRQEVQS